MPIVEISPTARAKCVFCSLAITKGELRVPLSERGYMGYTSTKYCHLKCCKARPPTSVTAFIGHDTLPEDQLAILQNFVDALNKSIVPSKKRRATDEIDNRKTKKIKSTAIAPDPALFDTIERGNINSLPIEITTMIFKHLPLADMAKTSHVCKMWLFLAENEDLWREYCQHRCADLPKEADLSWKQHFQRRLKKSCVECGALTNSGYFFHPLSARLCLQCRTLEQYKLIKKTDLKDRFRLTELDLTENGLKPQYITCNGTRAHFYLRAQVEQVAAKKIHAKKAAKSRK